jgi:hypothetical protein
MYESKYLSKITFYGPDDRTSIPGRSRYFFHHHVRTDYGAYSRGTRRCLLRDKVARTLNQSLTSTKAEVKKAWNITSTLPYVFTAWCLGREMDKYTEFKVRKIDNLPHIRVRCHSLLRAKSTAKRYTWIFTISYVLCAEEITWDYCFSCHVTLGLQTKNILIPLL